MTKAANDNNAGITTERLEQDARLRRVLMRLTATPRMWVQDDWLIPASDVDWPLEDLSPTDLEAPTAELTPADKSQCGTVGCACGWGALDAGIASLDKHGKLVIDVERALALGVDEDDLVDVGVVFSDGEPYWTGVGRVVFGLDKWQAEMMFAGSNSLMTLWLYAAEFTNDRVSLPPELANRVVEIDTKRKPVTGVVT